VGLIGRWFAGSGSGPCRRGIRHRVGAAVLSFHACRLSRDFTQISKPATPLALPIHKKLGRRRAAKMGKRSSLTPSLGYCYFGCIPLER
jgi:hypothetical protein